MFFWKEVYKMKKRSRFFFTCEENHISLFPPQGFWPFSFGTRWLVPSHYPRLYSTLTSSERLPLTTLLRVEEGTLLPTKTLPGHFLSNCHYLTLSCFVLLHQQSLQNLIGGQESCLSLNCCNLVSATVPGMQQVLKYQMNDQ